MVESVNTGANADNSQTAAPEGHNQQMAEKFDQTQEAARSPNTETAQTGEENELILGKFKSQEDLEEAYRNLEAKLSGGEEAGPDGDQEADQEGSEDADQEAAEKAVDRAEGVDMESLSQEYFKNGGLADESYEALEKAGIPRDMVDQFIEGQEAKAEKYGSQVVDSIGGDEAFQKMSEWASSNLDAESLDAYNAEVESGDPRRMEQAVQALAYRYGQARPTEPSLIGGQGQGGGPADSFQSTAQLTEAMKDPRYQKDPAYRQDVERRLAASNIL